ncbi:MAG: hypothetical protein HY754_04380, partial [Nitrospirae bacterium]|nr:hypothetical protein [Nitrospirota bacterium]
MDSIEKLSKNRNMKSIFSVLVYIVVFVVLCPVVVFAAGLPIITLNSSSQFDCGLQLNFSVNPNRASTTYHIDYQATGPGSCELSYDSSKYSTVETYVAADGKDHIIDTSLSGLSPNYYTLTVVATNSYGSSSADWYLVASCGINAANRESMNIIYMFSAVVYGCVNDPSGLDVTTTSWFEYGELGTEYRTGEILMDGVSSPCYSTCNPPYSYIRNVSLVGLQPGKTYKYRIAIKDSVKTAYSPFASFTTVSEMAEFNADYLYVVYQGYWSVNNTWREGNDIYKYKKDGFAVDYPCFETGVGCNEVYGCSYVEGCVHSCSKAISPDMRGNIYAVNSGEYNVFSCMVATGSAVKEFRYYGWDDFYTTGDYVVRYWGGTYDGKTMDTGKGIAVSMNDEVYITDSVNKRILRFSYDGVYINAYNDVITPAYIVTDYNGNVYVTYEGSAIVKKFDRYLSYLFSFGSGVLSRPSFIAVDRSSLSAGFIYVYDVNNKYIVQFNQSGDYVRKIYGVSGNGVLRADGGIDVSRDNDLYVSDGYSLCSYSNAGVIKGCMCLKNIWNWDDSLQKGTPDY